MSCSLTVAAVNSLSSYPDLLEDLLEACDLLRPLGSHEAPKIYPVDAGPDCEVNEFDATSDAFVVAVLDDELELFLWLK